MAFHSTLVTPLHIQIVLAAATLIVSGLGWAITVGTVRGMFTRAIGDHDRQFGELHLEQQQQWAKIGTTAEDLKLLQGRLRASHARATGAAGGT